MTDRDRPPAGMPVDATPQGRLRRGAPMAGAVARTAGEAVVAALRSKATGTPHHVDHERAAERYAQALGRSRGALMKAGQALSFMAVGTAVAPELRGAYQQALGKLRADAPPMSAACARGVLEAELGRHAEDAFAEIDWMPLAAASIGQVHRARTADGAAVAVKIQYPGVREAIEADLANHELLSTFLGMMMGFSPVRIGVDTRAVAREIAHHVREELDYVREARNQREFATLYRGHPFIRIPDVVDELSTARVLTQELAGGIGWSDAGAAPDTLRQQWAEAICRFGYGSIDHFLLFNVDAHPGNYRFHDDGSITALDFGSVCHMTPRLGGLISKLTSAAVKGDAAAVRDASLDAGVWTAADPVSADEMLAYWRAGLTAYWSEQPYTFTPEHVGAWVAQQFDPTGPMANQLRHINSPEQFTLMSRMDIGIASMLGELHARNEWRAIFEEFMENGPPATPMGERELAWLHAHPTAIQHA